MRDAVTQHRKALIIRSFSRKVKSGTAGERLDGAYSGRIYLLDPRSFRLRNFLAIALAAVFTAAVLRHVLHVYGGISREDIRANALLAILIVAVATILFRRMSRRRQR